MWLLSRPKSVHGPLVFTPWCPVPPPKDNPLTKIRVSSEGNLLKCAIVLLALRMNYGKLWRKYVNRKIIQSSKHFLVVSLPTSAEIVKNLSMMPSARSLPKLPISIPLRTKEISILLCRICFFSRKFNLRGVDPTASYLVCASLPSLWGSLGKIPKLAPLTCLIGIYLDFSYSASTTIW